MKDHQDILLTSLNEAAFIIGDYLEPEFPRDPVATINRLIEVPRCFRRTLPNEARSGEDYDRQVQLGGSAQSKPIRQWLGQSNRLARGRRSQRRFLWTGECRHGERSTRDRCKSWFMIISNLIRRSNTSYLCRAGFILLASCEGC
jgi:hypothetical protein